MAKDFREQNLPFWGLVVFSLVSPLSIAATNAAWVITLLLWLYQTFQQGFRRKMAFQKTDLDFGFGLFFIASLFSLSVSLTPMVSLIEFRSLGLIVIYYLFAWNIKDGREMKWIIICLLISTSLSAALGFIQFYTGWDLLGHYHPSNQKASGFFSIHLTFGEYLALTGCFCLGIIFWARPRKIFFFFVIFAFFLMAGGIVLSGAKGAILGLLVGAAFLSGLRGKRAFLIATSLVLLFVVILLSFKSGLFFNYVVAQLKVDANQAAGPVGSNTQRLYMWWSGFRISLGYLINGVGLHAVEAVYPAYRSPMAIAPNQWHLHSTFIQLVVTRGLFGLTVLLYLFFLAFRSGYLRFKLSQDPLEKGISAGVLGALPAFLVCGLTEYCWGDSEVLMLFYMLLGLSSSISTSSVPERQQKERDVGWLKKISFMAISAVIIVLPFLLIKTVDAGPVVILQPVLGILLLWLLFYKPSLYEVPPVWKKQIIAWIVVFTGYTFTRPLWSDGLESIISPTILMALTVILAFFAAIFSGLLFYEWIRSSSTVTLFDAASFAAPLLWIFLSLGTYCLMRFARLEQSLVSLTLLNILALGAMVILLYGVSRYFYVGDRSQKILLTIIGLGTILQAYM